MAEATWGDANAPSIDWKMSASLRNVSRGDEELPEVTNLQAAVRAWQQLDPEMKAAAELALEPPAFTAPWTVVSAAAVVTSRSTPSAAERR